MTISNPGIQPTYVTFLCVSTNVQMTQSNVGPPITLCALCGSSMTHRCIVEEIFDDGSPKQL